MKKSIFITAVVLVAALFVFQFAFAGEKNKMVEGELVDTKCFVGMGAKGADHQECAVKCAEMGIPLGVLTKKDKLYIVLHITPGLAQYAGQMVRFDRSVP